MTDSLLRGKRFYCREWAFSKLLHCLETRQNSKTCGTLVMGGPGCGKTALGCEVVWPTSTQGKQSALNSHLLAFHFCQAHDSSSLSVVKFINSIVSQVTKSPHVKNFSSKISSPNTQHLLSPTECECNADEAFKTAFLEPLLSSEPPEHPLILWVDSIDESYLQPVNDRPLCSQTIAELLAAHHSNFPPWLLLVCSARKQSKVVTRMFTGFRKLSLDDLRKSHIVRDVQQYILCRLDAEEGLRQHLSRDTAEMLNQLHIKSNGCFLYLEKVLDGVAESFIMLREVREIPGTLNGLYLWLCQRLFIKKNVGKIQPIFNVLLAARTPVDTDELYKCMLYHNSTLTKEDFEFRMRLMNRVLTTGPKGEQLFFHHSFAEWMLDVKHCTQKYLCDASQGHALLALRQLQYARDLNSQQVQDLALHLVRSDFPEPIQTEHLTQLLIISGARVERCFSVGLPREQKVLKLLNDAGANSCMEDSTASVESLLEAEENEAHVKDKVSLPLNETDGNGRTQLHTASYRGNSKMVEELIHLGANLEIQDHSGQTALTLAARQGHAKIVGSLIQAGIDVNHADHEGCTALRSGAWAGHTQVVSLLLNKGAEVDFADGEQRTALRAACWGGHEDVVKLLLDHQANVDKTDQEGRTALIAAAYMGHVEIVEQLLDHGSHIDHEDCDGRTALSVACLCVPASEGHERVVSLLLERDAEVDHKDKDGSTPLLVAAYEGHPGVCDMLLEWDADADHVDCKNRTPLWAACSMGHELVVKQLLFWGAAVDHIDNEGRTVLCVASAQGSESVVRQLLDRGLDEMHRDNSGWTPLHLAGYEGHLQICTMLLDQGAKINEVDNDGRVALIQAAQEGHLEVVKLLVEKGAFLNHRSHDGKTALRVAAIEGHLKVLSYLITAGADVNYKDADGRSTLYVIALDGNLEVLEKLISSQADLEEVDTEGRTGLHVASWQGNLEIVQSLIRSGAKVNSVDNDRRTAVQSASWQGHDNIVRVLLEAGARVDHTCNQGATALCIAAQEGHEEVVKMLLSFQANPNHADQFGRTPYRVALKSGHQNICAILEDFGAIVPNGAKSRSNSSTSSGEIKLNTPMSTSSVKVCGLTGSTAANDSEGKTMKNGSLQISSSASPESSYDRRKSCNSNLSSRSSSILTSSTNQSGHSCQSGPSNSSRLDRECLTFTQQLQQCSMGKNRSRPISRVLSPVSEPQSPFRSPATTPVKEGPVVGDFDDSRLMNNINTSVSSPLKHTSAKPERLSATINIITNPHADMMSSVEEPVWQKNPSYPGHMQLNYPATTTSSSSSSSCSSQTQSGSHLLGHNDSPTSGTSGNRIIMGRTSLTSRSPEYRGKRNGIVTNPKVTKSSSGSSNSYNRLSQSSVPPHASENNHSNDGACSVNSLNHREPFEPTVSPIHSAFRASNKNVLSQSTDIVLPHGRLTQSNMKAVRPNGLPIKKFEAQ